MQAVITCPTCAAKLGVISHKPGTPVFCPKCQNNFVPTATAPPAPPIPSQPAPRPVEPLELDDDPQPRSRTPLIAAAALLVLVAGVAAFFVLREKPREDSPAIAEAPSQNPPTRTAEKNVPPTAPTAAKANPGASPPPSVLITETPRTAEQVNKRLLKSTVWIYIEGLGFRSNGSGSLVHQQRGLVVTNYHVVGANSTVDVYFPAVSPTGDLLTDPSQYITNRNTLRIRGTVVDKSASLDLAVVRLDRVPSSALGLPLASKPAATGASVYSLGASGVELRRLSGALWRFSTGTVRGRYRDRSVFPDQTIEAMILETQKPINPGDSGGPTVNDRGELVGVVSMATKPLKGNLLMSDIDLVEVRAFLAAHAKKDGWTWIDREAAPPAGGQDPATVTQIIARVRSEKGDAQLYSIRQLGAIGTDAKAAIPILLAVANPASAELEAAISAALTKIGPPEAGSDDALIQAIASKSVAVRTYAVRSLAAGATIPDAAIAPLLKAVTDAAADVRQGAVTALGIAGPKAKADALAPLLERADDADPAVASAAAQSIAKFGPFSETEKQLFAARLSDKSVKIRQAAAGWITQLVTMPDEAYTIWSPILTDASPELRVIALANIAKHPTVFPKVGVTVVELISDRDTSVRLAAVTLAVKFKGVDGIEGRLARVLSEDTSAEVRAAAAASAAVIAEARVSNLGLLRQLLLTNSPAAKRVAAEKLAELKGGASPAVDDLIVCVGDSDAEVCTPAIRALLAVGKEGSRGREVVTKVFTNEKSADAVLVAAADYLAATEGSLKTLRDARNRPLPADAILALCRAFAPTGDAALLRWMTGQAVEFKQCREVVTGALAKHADDEHVRELIEHTYSIKPRKPGEREQRATIESRRWALATLAQIDTAKVCTPATREKLRDRVKALSSASGANEKELAAEAAAFYRPSKP